MNSNKKLLKEVRKLLNKNGIHFWLTCGTMLGAIKYKDFCHGKKTNDIDLGLWIEDYWKVRKLLKQNPQFKIKGLWRVEICIYLDDESHLDLFFYEKKGDKITEYIHEGNQLSGFWEVERQFIYDKYIFKKFIDVKFLGMICKIPEKYEDYFNIRYTPEWRKDGCKEWWNSDFVSTWNKDWRQIAILIPTFLRDEAVITEIKSIANTLPKHQYRLYIGDQSFKEGEKPTGEKKQLYDCLEKIGHKIVRLPYNCGLSYARNALVDASTEPYLLIMDDDFLFSKECSDLSPFIQVLLAEEKIGIVGGKLKNREQFTFKLEIDKKNHKFYQREINPEWKQTVKTAGQKRPNYFITDSVLNFYLAKREVFDAVRWDNDLLLVEHSDFCLRFKDTKWKMAFTPDVKVGHMDKTINSDKYNKFRDPVNGENCKIGFERFFKKWGLTSRKDWIRVKLEKNSIKKSKQIITNNDKLDVCKIIDQYGWAYYFIAKEMAKYSKHNVTYQKYDNMDYSKMNVMYMSSPGIDTLNMGELARRIIPYNAQQKGVKVIGGYSGEINLLYEYADLIATISPQLYYFAKNNYKDIPVIFVPESVDTEFFTSKKFDKNRFDVGWAGGKNKRIKRPYLLDNLDFPVKKQSDWGKAYFKEDRTLDPMKEFYNSIDCFVLTSTTECMPRVVLEAMACGLPVVATDVGALRMLIDKEWIVPVYPEKTVVEKINYRLALLAKYPKLRQEVGKRNRKHIEKYFSWKNNIKIWDNIFTSLVKEDYSKIDKISQKFINQFKDIFDRYAYDSKPLSIDKKNTIPKITIRDVLNKIKGTNTMHCLLDISCLDAIRFGRLALDKKTLHIGVPSVSEANIIKQSLTELGFSCHENNILTNITGYKVILKEQILEKTKTMPLYDVPMLVPCPVVRYLYTMFGSKWQEYK